MTHLRLAPVLLVVAACSSGRAEPASTPPAGAVPGAPLPQPVAAPPVLALLGQREVLGLSSDQIGRLEAIALALREENDSLETSVRDEGRQRGRIRTARDQRRALRDALPTLGQIWGNNRRAMNEVHDVLTPEQRAQVCAQERERMADRSVEEQRRDLMRRRVDSRTRTMRRMGPDSVMAGAVRGWGWCMRSTVPRAQPAATATSPAPAPAPATRPAP